MTQDTIKQRLSAARALIDQPEKWTQGAFQRNARGLAVEPRCGAVAYCAYGAIRETCAESQQFEIMSRLVNCINRHGGCCYELAPWNDAPERTYAEVMQAFDRAIEDASAPSVAGILVLNDRLDRHLKELKALDRAIEYK